MAPPVSLQDECEPLWKGYRFRSPSKEDQYRDKWQTPMVQVCQIWCLVHLVMDGLVPIPNLFEISKVGLGHAFSLSFVPSLALAVTTLFLVSFVPWCRRHIVTVTSIASVLMAALTAAMVHTHTDLWIHHSQQRDLSLVVNRVAGDEEAMAQLQTFLTNQFSSYQIWKNLLLRTGLEVLLLSYVGVYQSTVVAMILVSAVLCTIFSWSPLIPLWAAVKGSMVVVVVIVWVLLVGRLWTKSRRHSFLLERFFEEALKVAVNASRHADSILNHTLKNTMADAASDVELFLEGLEAGTGAIDETHLQKAAASLWRGMRSCRNRQAYLNLVAGKYCIALQSTHLTKFVEELTVGRNVRVDVPDEVVCIDERLCNLILDNALSNAFKHGHPKHPDVQLSIQVSQCIPSPDKAQLTATVTNVSHPARPAVTPEYVAKVLAGEAQLGPTTSAISDRIGLQHSFMAAETMGADLKLTQTGQQVAFVIQLEVEVADHVPAKSSADSHSGAATVVFPCDLCICCIDDSEAARRLLHHHLVTLANTKQVHMFGANEVPLPLPQALPVPFLLPLLLFPCGVGAGGPVSMWAFFVLVTVVHLGPT